MAAQEGQGRGFDESNRLIILYEPLHFLRSQDANLRKLERLAFHRTFQADYPLLTKLKPKPHQYGLLDDNWRFLQWSYLLNPKDALQVVSWGQFQILGSNFRLAGYASPEAFVTAMCRSLQDQLQAFVQFIQNLGAQDALAKKDWASFAFACNGASYREKHYDQKIEAKYKKLAAATTKNR